MSPEDRRRPTDAPLVAPEPGTIADIFAEVLAGIEFVPAQGPRDVMLLVPPRDVHAVLERAKHDPRLRMNFLRDLCGVDYEDEGMEVVYQLWSYELRHGVTIRTRLSLADLNVMSATDLWRGADWHEREVRDMFGIHFVGHPNLVPLLLPDDMLDHFPLRKSNPLAPLEEWQGELLGPKMGEAGHIPPGSGFEVEASTEAE
jgi:NADH:ubiquinone oxidoreductase subunit C